MTAKESQDNDLSKEIAEKINELDSLLLNFKEKLTKPVKNSNIYLRYLKQRIEFVDWANRKFNLQFADIPKNVYKRDIFFCEFGYNIGSEQNHKRPVVILQNDKGNSSSTTTIVAPITTYENSVILKEDGKYRIEFTNDNGEKVSKKLDYYEIPVELESNYKIKIQGYINLAQIRTISKKRLHKSYIAKITTDTELKINNSLKRLL